MSSLVGYLDFVKVPHIPNDPTTGLPYVNHYTGQKGQISVVGTYNNAGAATKVMAHYLPWLDNAVVSLTIPVMPQFGGGPKVFFTAAINGCSVFIKGTAKSPTIYHAGGATYRPEPNEGAKFWRDMMKTRKDTALGKIQAEVNKTMYVTDKKDKALGTANSRLFEQWLTANPQGFTIEDVSPTGCVFGLRDSGEWKFYLQENVSIRYTSVTIALGQPPVAKSHTLVRPMQIREIFPNGNGNATVAPALSRPFKA
jgi:hypothetical protein